MKYLLKLIVCFFLSSPIFAQEFNIIDSFNAVSENNEIKEDFQITSEGSFLLCTHHDKDWTSDKFIIYQMDKEFKKIKETIVESNVELDEGLEFLGFSKNRWYYLTEKKTNRATFDYGLISISVDGKIEKKTIKTGQYVNPMNHKSGIISNGIEIESENIAFDISPDKQNFLIILRINHKALLAFVYNNDGLLLNEKEIFYLNSDEKEKTSDEPRIKDVYIDNKQNFYIVLSDGINLKGYTRYCSFIEGKVLIKKVECQGKKNLATTFFEENGVVSLLTLYSDLNAVGKKSGTGEIYTMSEGKTTPTKTFYEDFENNDYLSEQYIINSNKKIFLSTNIIDGESSTLLRDLTLFSIEDNNIKDMVKVNRAIFGDRYIKWGGGFKAKFWIFNDNYFIIFNSTEKRTGIKVSGADDSALFLTKINSSFKEEYTKEVLGKESYYVGANTIIKSGDKLIMITIWNNEYKILSTKLE